MKDKITKWLEKLEHKRGIGRVFKALKKGWLMISHNFGLKMLSLLVAILLWNFVITTNASITRTKTVTGLTGYMTGRTTLTDAYGLALLDDPSEALNDVSVMLDVAQSDFSSVTPNNVQVTLDLSNVRRTGVQEIPLKATTNYGRILKIIPSTVLLNVETLDSRVIPVNVQMVGKPESDRWYKVNRSNPASLTIKGPASLVQSIASAYVYIDVTDARSNFTAVEQFVLLDNEGNEISQKMLERSASSVSVSMDVYPIKEIPVSKDLGNVIIGQPADGYVVTNVSIQPESLTVAADQDLLDDINSLLINPVSVEGMSQSFSARAKVSKLSAFKSISAEEVYINVTIAEETVSAWVEDVRISYINKGEGLSMIAPEKTVRVYVTGPRSAIEELQQNGFVATVELEGLGVGSHSLGISFPVTTFPDVVFTPEKGEISVVLSR